MPAGKMTVNVVSHVKEITAAVQAALDQTIRGAAFEVQGEAAARSRVDTSAMKNAWTVQLKNGSDYPRVSAKARALNPEGEQFPEERPAKRLEAIIANVMAYAFYHEFGTVHLAPQPMLSPALERIRQGFEARVRAQLKGLE